MTRSSETGEVLLRGIASTRPKGGTGFRLNWTLLGWRLIIAFLTLIGLAFTPVVFSVLMADGAANGGAGANDLGQIVNMLQAMANEQQQQRARLDTLQQAVGTTAQGVGVTQQVTEGVVQEVVQQVQAAMQQNQQDAQGQIQQMQQGQVLMQQQIEAAIQQSHQEVLNLSQALQGMQQQMQQQTAAQIPVPGSPPQVPQAAPGVQGSPQHQALGSPLGTPPMGATGAPNAQFIPPPNVNLGGHAGVAGLGGLGPGVNPAIAYAIQQGGVDAKVLSKPSTYDPVKSPGYAAFNDWSDHVITCVDAQIPGTWELLEHIKDTQPVAQVSIDDLSLHFPNIDRATLEYSNSNLYAVLITFTVGEARNIVRQARRPNGYEAWKLLQRRFNPVTIGRQRAGLTTIANPPSNVPMAQLAGEIVSWETKITEFEARPHAEKISEAIKMAAAVSMCPNRLREHLQLNAQRYTTYMELREEIFTYIEHTQSLTATSMDIGSLQSKGKGGGCFECGGPDLIKDCPKRAKGGQEAGKGKSKDKGKGKGGKDSKGKGKASSKDGGKGKNKSACSNCGKVGHTAEYCWNKKVKPLNSVDPRLSQLQSEYARRAVEDFQRINSGSNVVQAVQGSPQSSVVGALSPASSVLGPSVSQAQQQVGGNTIKRLSALSSRHAKRARGSGAGSSGDGQGTEQNIDLTLSSKTYAVLSNVDSGAAMSVCPPGTFPDYPVLARDDEEEIVLVAANEETVEHYGEVRPIVMTSEGHLREMVFQVAAVGKVLTSAAQICNRGHRIVLESEGGRSYIEDKETGDTFNLYQEDAVFNLYLHVIPYAETTGFCGQPTGSSAPADPQA